VSPQQEAWLISSYQEVIATFDIINADVKNLNYTQSHVTKNNILRSMKKE